MPAEARSASPAELSALRKTAAARGYSRTGKGISPRNDPGVKYIVTPLQPESTPESSWICLVLEFQFGDEILGRRTSDRGPVKLDVSVRNFSRLRKLTRQEKNEVVHRLDVVEHDFG